jgi:signal transduction histidine kinase
MFRSLRSKLMLSQILPLLLVLPLMGLLLIYTLESQVLIPKLGNTLLGDARLLSEISSAEYELWGNPVLFENLISRVKLDQAIDVMFLDAHGYVLFSSSTQIPENSQVIIQNQGVTTARQGREAALTTYSILQLKNVLIDVYEPVTDSDNEVVGIVRLTYRVGSLYEILGQMRWEIILVMLVGLLVSAIIGSALALSISRPITRVTNAIYDLAVGKRHEPLAVEGAEELQAQSQAVNYLVEQLHGLEKSRKQLLANLVHELGRPLGAIRSAIHALQNGADKDPALYHDLTTGLDAETTRLKRLLDELANLYEESLGGLEMNYQQVDIHAWLPGVVKSWQAAAAEKGLQWDETIAPDLPAVPMDPDRMAQVVGNLLSNAIKYTRAGGRIQLEVTATSDEFLLSVRDTGCGIHPEELDKIQQPFYRGEQGRRIKQGMGLGLTIASDLTRAHHGRLEIDSKVNEGSLFTIHLPLVKPEAEIGNG